ncbi:zinc finger CCCH domain-containing protein 3 [Impatiens glandulifera]|uniref:zinc finger CCCH domain-containing protein 3 n=1 Tax=Impatiens glandulifera TaxID=253017 RepID=UPI001FB17D45|nr:zinc finger CCCH domain-containing protein 3 [Impatiens glandulifera]
MPLGKYHCDYCDKQFQDTPSARKRHLQGIQHKRAKAFWFDSFRDPNLVNPETSIGNAVCHRFMRTGSCQYGDLCKYYHPKQNLQTMNPTSVSQGEGSSREGDVMVEKLGVSWGNLPPSLKPPLPENGYSSLPLVDWG